MTPAHNPSSGVRRSTRQASEEAATTAGQTDSRQPTPADAEAAYDALVARDPVLHRLTRTYGRPDPFFWVGMERVQASNFAAMVLHITSQQISTAVAFVIFDRIRDAIGSDPDPEGILRMGPDSLRAMGLSRGKARYVTALAEAQLSGALDIEHLDGLSDQEVIKALTAVPGIGLWTSQMFLINQLRRPDILPAGDLGIRHAIQAAWPRPGVPTIDEVAKFGERWAPHRTYAAALLWASLHAPEPAD